ncbi:hypothetical protein BaRGS_00028622 [Batillaria attramentaria]|uniref:Secreted protein n=1 Tax=Batillaria attramentaria TaxID=370345 RepID=A0ABD0JZ12_9CAEN
MVHITTHFILLLFSLCPVTCILSVEGRRTSSTPAQLLKGRVTRSKAYAILPASLTVVVSGAMAETAEAERTNHTRKLNARHDRQSKDSPRSVSRTKILKKFFTLSDTPTNSKLGYRRKQTSPCGCLNKPINFLLSQSHSRCTAVSVRLQFDTDLDGIGRILYSGLDSGKSVCLSGRKKRGLKRSYLETVVTIWSNIWVTENPTF